ncbi:HEAT repeat domain-containing protein [Pseudomonas sp. LPB0260]|uniref:HEAT repeat domain-containing protein n=1 Tax=Pseudomonas sp. LPB0260 TaxID=2614442 RepID=UPI0015C2385B|nr:HEAT repeat domain-containing protein [Pseudomonas sp. LPB0260]QLC72834.1 HEAT repeat domain-containing protein [Pseudomonas sp. LPB0260]QLC75608.1 HEAT repeat domain-containing protein [Pseudomonas sp. LPB0260]
MTSKWLFSGAFLFELSSWASLSAQLPVGQAALLYAAAHALGSLLLSAGIWLLLPRRYKFPLPWSPLFIFALAFFVPLLGAIGVILAVFPALYLPRKQQEQAWDAMAVPDLPFRPQDQRGDLMFSDGGLQDVVRHAPSTEKRLNALFATRRMDGRDSIPILKLALRDPADDVRLLAYSMLDQQESRINQRIEAALGELAAAAEEQRPALHATLARWYWELAYLGLAQGSVLEHVLNQAREHVEQSLVGANSGESHLLAGRIALQQGLLDQAEAHFQQAEAAGIDAQKLVPFRAEIAFLQRRYGDIPALLATLPAQLLQRPPFAELARYWL